MAEIIYGGVVNPHGPVDARGLCATSGDIYNISMAYVGMPVTTQDGNAYIVTEINGQGYPTNFRKDNPDLDYDEISHNVENSLSGWLDNMKSTLSGFLATIKSETITDLSNTSDNVSTEVTKYNKSVQSLEERINKLLISIGDIQETANYITDAKNRIIETKDLIQDRINSFNFEIANAKNKQEAALQAAKKEYEDALKESRDMIADAKNFYLENQNTLAERITQMRDEWENAVVEARELIDNKLEYAKQSLSAANATYQAVIDEKYNQYSDAVETFSTLAELKQNELDNKVQTAQAIINNAKNELDGAKIEIQNTKDYLDALVDSTGFSQVKIDEVLAQVQTSAWFADVSANTLNEAQQLIDGKTAEIITSAKSISDSAITKAVQDINASMGTLETTLRQEIPDMGSVTEMTNWWDVNKGEMQTVISRVNAIDQTVATTLANLDTEGISYLSERINAAEEAATSASLALSNLDGTIEAKVQSYNSEHFSDWENVVNAASGYMATSGSYLTTNGEGQTYENLVDLVNGVRSEALTSLQNASGLLSNYIDTVDVKAGSAETAMNWINTNQGIIGTVQEIQDAQRGFSEQINQFVKSGEVNTLISQKVDAASGSIMTEMSSYQTGVNNSLTSYRSEINTLSGQIDTVLEVVTPESLSSIQEFMNGAEAMKTEIYGRVSGDVSSLVNNTMSSYGYITSAELKDLNLNEFTNIESQIDTRLGTMRDSITSLTQNMNTTLETSLRAEIGGVENNFRSTIASASGNLTSEYISYVNTVSGDIKESMTTIINDVEGLSSAVSTFQTSYDAIRGSAETAYRYTTESAETKIQEAIDIANGAVTSVTQYIDIVNGHTTQINQITDSNNGIQATLLKKINPISGSLTSLESRLDTTEASISNAADWISNSGASKNHVEQEINALSATVKTSISAVSTAVTNSLEQIISDHGIDTIATNYNAVNSTLSTISSNLDTLSGTVKTLNEWKSATAETSFSTLQNSIEGVESRVQTTINKVSGDLTTFSSSTNTTLGTLETSLEQISTASATCFGYKATIDAAAASARTAIQRADLANASAVTIHNDVNAISGTVSQITSAVDEFNDKAASAGWTTEANGGASNVSSFATFADYLTSTITDARLNIDAAQKQIDLTVQEVNQNGMTISQISQTTNSISQLVENGDIAAGIVLAINNSESEIKLNADKIKLEGDTFVKNLNTSDLSLGKYVTEFKSDGTGQIGGGGLRWGGTGSLNIGGDYYEQIGAVSLSFPTKNYISSYTQSVNFTTELTDAKNSFSGIVTKLRNVNDVTSGMTAIQELRELQSLAYPSVADPSNKPYLYKVLEPNINSCLSAWETYLNSDKSANDLTAFTNSISNAETSIIQLYGNTQNNLSLSDFSNDLIVSYQFTKSDNYNDDVTVCFVDGFGNVIKSGVISGVNTTLTIEAPISKFGLDNAIIKAYSTKPCSVVRHIYINVNTPFYVKADSTVSQLNFTKELSEANSDYRLIGPVDFFYDGTYQVSRRTKDGGTYENVTIKGVYRGNDIENGIANLDVGDSLTLSNSKQPDSNGKYIGVKYFMNPNPYDDNGYRKAYILVQINKLSNRTSDASQNDIENDIELDYLREDNRNNTRRFRLHCTPEGYDGVGIHLDNSGKLTITDPSTDFLHEFVCSAETVDSQENTGVINYTKGDFINALAEHYTGTTYGDELYTNEGLFFRYRVMRGFFDAFTDAVRRYFVKNSTKLFKYNLEEVENVSEVMFNLTDEELNWLIYYMIYNDGACILDSED